MIDKLYLECAALAVATRVILAGALWIAASVALGGCASQSRAAHAVPPTSMAAPVTEQAPGFRVAGPHLAPDLELPAPDLRGEGDLIQPRLRRCERDEEHDAGIHPVTDMRHELECGQPRRGVARASQVAVGG